MKPDRMSVAAENDVLLLTEFALGSGDAILRDGSMRDDSEVLIATTTGMHRVTGVVEEALFQVLPEHLFQIRDVLTAFIEDKDLTR